jgi:hypothetical protein
MELKKEFPIGTIVRPLKSKKDEASSWLHGFSGKNYPVKGYDQLDGRHLLVLDTSAYESPGWPLETAYELVYPSEVRIMRRPMSKREARNLVKAAILATNSARRHKRLTADQRGYRMKARDWLAATVSAWDPVNSPEMAKKFAKKINPKGLPIGGSINP